MVPLNEVSQKFQAFLAKYFNLEENMDQLSCIKINEYGHMTARFEVTPLIFAIARDVPPQFRHSYLEIIEELLEKGADINKTSSVGLSPLFYAIQAANVEAFDALIDHSNSSNKKISFNAIFKEPTNDVPGRDYISGHYYEESILLILIRFTFSTPSYDIFNHKYIEEFEKYRTMLSRLLLEESVDFNFYNNGRNAISVLLAYFEDINQRAHLYRIPFFMEVLQILIQEGVNLNINYISNRSLLARKDELFDKDGFFIYGINKAAIISLFSFDIEEDEDEDDNVTFTNDQEINLMNVLKLLFKQAQDIHLDVYDECEFQMGSPLKKAMSIPIPNVVELLCEEIRCQALKIILEEKNKKIDKILNSCDRYVLKEKVKEFVLDHNFNNDQLNSNENAGSSSEGSSEQANQANKEANENRNVIDVLNERVLNFVEKMMEPKKFLSEIIFTDSLKKQLTEAGFNLSGDFKQVSKDGHSLLAFAARNNLKELILCLALQPAFNQYFKNSEISKAIVSAMDQDNQAICSILLGNIELSQELFSKLIEKAIVKGKSHYVKFFVDYYNKIGGPKVLKFNLLDPKQSYYKSLLSRSLMLGNCPYLIQELMRMTIENAPKYNATPSLLDTKLNMEERSKEYAAQFLERHDSNSMEIIQLHIINPYMEYYKYMRKVLIDCGLLHPQRVTCIKGPNKDLTRIVAFSNVHVTNILHYIDSPFGSLFKARNHNILDAVVRSVQMCYNKVYKNRERQQEKEAELAKKAQLAKQAELEKQKGEELELCFVDPENHENRSAKRQKLVHNTELVHNKQQAHIKETDLTWSFASQSFLKDSSQSSSQDSSTPTVMDFSKDFSDLECMDVSDSNKKSGSKSLKYQTQFRV